MQTTVKVKVGPNKGKPSSRVWLEGKRLLDAGFTVGTRYSRVVSGSTVVINASDAGKYKVSGKGEKPIIDIAGAIVENLFGDLESVTVEFFTDGVISISR